MQHLVAQFVGGARAPCLLGVPVGHHLAHGHRVVALAPDVLTIRHPADDAIGLRPCLLRRQRVALAERARGLALALPVPHEHDPTAAARAQTHCQLRPLCVVDQALTRGRQRQCRDRGLGEPDALAALAIRCSGGCGLQWCRWCACRACHGLQSGHQRHALRGVKAWVFQGLDEGLRGRVRGSHLIAFPDRRMNLGEAQGNAREQTRACDGMVSLT